MNSKVFWCDVETTGLKAAENDIIQLAYAIEIDGDVKTSGEFKMQPFSYENISPEATDVHGITVDELRTYPTPQEVHAKLVEGVLAHVVNRYDRADKLQPAGFNVGFDVAFLRAWFKKNLDEYYGSWFNYYDMDPLKVLYYLRGLGYIDLPNYKLGTVCEYFGIPLDPHDAQADLVATREVARVLNERFLVPVKAEL